MKSLNEKFTLSLLLALFFCGSAGAQNNWSLERCIQYAQQNSLTIKQAEYAVKSAQVAETQSRMERLPSLNGSGSFGIQAGRTIDPTTNTFVTDNVKFSSYSLNAGMTIFDGFRINNSIKQSQFDVQATEKDMEATVNNLALNIASAYLNVLLAEEQKTNAQRQLGQINEQLSQTDKLIKVGVLPENDRLDILAQAALTEQTLVQANNAVDLAYLTLKQLLELEPGLDISVEKPTIIMPADANPENFNLESVYAQALSSQPQIEAGNIRMESADIGVKIAQSQLLPSLTIFGGLSSNWSSAKRDFTDPQVVGIDTRTLTSDVFIEGFGSTNITQTIQEPTIEFPKQSFGDQLNENFGQNVGLSLNIPIFNNYRNRANIERAEIGMLNQQVANQRAKQQLKADVQNAIANARASKKSYEASQKALDAARIALSNAERRFELGVINTFELSTAQNNRDRAEIDLTTAKYQYLFNLKVVDFYLGKELTL